MRTSEITEAAGVDRKTVGRWAAVLPTEAKPVRRQPTEWSVGDSCAMLVVLDLIGRGLTEDVALAMVAAMLPHFVRMTATGASAWAVAWHDEAEGWVVEIVEDRAAGFEILMRQPAAVVVAIHDVLHDALALIAAATIGSPRRG